MQRLTLPAALTIVLCVTACAGSLPDLTGQPSLALTDAAAQVDKRLDCPAPPPELLLCQEGSTPTLAGKGAMQIYWCPQPHAVSDAIDNAPLKDALAETIGASLKETDLRFRTLHWFDQCRASAQPAAKP